MMTDPEREEDDGILEHPVFGEMPKVSPPGSPRRIFKYAQLLHVIRQHPNSPAMIAAYETGHPQETFRKARNAKIMVVNWIHKNYPTEVWYIAMRRIPDTWSRREIWAEFKGEIPLEDAMEARRIGHLAFQKNIATHQERMRLREARARLLAKAQLQAHRDATG
jgi:hypothetical protein